ncbi:hypothetical protein KJ611_03805 [Patescibacteria group bacterium]|nr:hypothetical protein [Patescibacteria group bacterium]MBU1705721.1 hypothetical protein [Patescibacteria group bacterium]
MSPTAKTLKLLMLGPVLIGLFGLLFLSAAPVARAQAVNARCLCYFRVDDANFKDEIGKYCQVVTPVSEPGADQGLYYCNVACPNDVGLRIDKKYYDVSFINQLFIADPSTAPTA